MITFEDIQKAYYIKEDGTIINKITNKIKKTFISKNGYKRVTLWCNGKQQKMSIHRLVALTYLPNPNNLEQVNHKDGNKLNNHLSNLEWCNQSHNTKEAYKLNLIKPKTVKVNQYDENGNFIKQWNSITDVCNILKLNHANISTVCKGNTNRKTVGGYIWKYVKEF